MTKKILIISAANSVHTRKITNSYNENEYEVYVFSIHKPLQGYNSNVVFIKPKYKCYMFAVLSLRRHLVYNKYDIIHAHYASGYGILALLCGEKYYLSIWGSDVLIFPHKSIIHKKIILKVMNNAECVFSTSKYMIRNVKNKLGFKKSIILAPFNLDKSFEKSEFDKDRSRTSLIICKSLKHVYGIDIAIKALFLIKKECHDLIHLNIVGEGNERANLEQLIFKLDIIDDVTFIGEVDNKDIKKHLENSDIYLAPSRSESFGVSVIEASAMGVVPICSNIECFSEVCIDNITGFILKKNSIFELANKIKYIINNPIKLEELKSAGREFVYERYMKKNPVDVYIKYYNK